jgi:hypothetical protein
MKFDNKELKELATLLEKLKLELSEREYFLLTESLSRSQRHYLYLDKIVSSWGFLLKQESIGDFVFHINNNIDRVRVEYDGNFIIFKSVFTDFNVCIKFYKLEEQNLKIADIFKSGNTELAIALIKSIS